MFPNTARKQKFQVCKSHQWDCSGFLGAQGKIKPGPANHCPLNICSLSQAWEGFSAPAFRKPAGTCRLDFPRVPSAFQNPQWNSGSPGCVEALSCSCILCSVMWLSLGSAEAQQPSDQQQIKRPSSYFHFLTPPAALLVLLFHQF